MKRLALVSVVLALADVVLLLTAPWHDVSEVDPFPCLLPDCHGAPSAGPMKTCLATAHLSGLEIGLLLAAFAIAAGLVVFSVSRTPGPLAVLSSLAGGLLFGGAAFWTLLSGGLAHMFSGPQPRVGEPAFAITSGAQLLLVLGLTIANGVLAVRARRARRAALAPA